MEVSLVFLNDHAMQRVNKTWRKRNTPANVLAFRLDSAMGEVVIDPFEAEREARHLGMSYTLRVAYLFLHGLLHLYGYDHATEQGARKMGKREREIMQAF